MAPRKMLFTVPDKMSAYPDARQRVHTQTPLSSFVNARGFFNERGCVNVRGVMKVRGFVCHAELHPMTATAARNMQAQETLVVANPRQCAHGTQLLRLGING